MEVLQEFFETKGYNVVALPKTTIKPLQLLAEEDGSLISLENRVDKLFEEDLVPLPAIYRNKTVSDLEGQTKFTFQMKSGFVFLEGLLKTLDLGSLSAKSEFKDSDKIVFSFNNIKEDGIKGFLDLDEYITGSIPMVDKFRAFKTKLEKSELFIVTSVLKCSDFSVKVLDKNLQDITANLNIKNVAAATAEMKRTKDNSLNITHTGDEKLVVAFKAVQIIYDAKKWFEFWSKKEAGFCIKAQTGWTLRGIDNFPVKALKADSGSFDI